MGEMVGSLVIGDAVGAVVGLAVGTVVGVETGGGEAVGARGFTKLVLQVFLQKENCKNTCNTCVVNPPAAKLRNVVSLSDMPISNQPY